MHCILGYDCLHFSVYGAAWFGKLLPLDVVWATSDINEVFALGAAWLVTAFMRALSAIDQIWLICIVVFPYLKVLGSSCVWTLVVFLKLFHWGLPLLLLSDDRFSWLIVVEPKSDALLLAEEFGTVGFDRCWIDRLIWDHWWRRGMNSWRAMNK